MTRQRAVFVDRDGVINANRSDHVKSWDEFVFLPHALEALRELAASDFAVVVTTNQAAINRRLVAEEAVRDIHSRMAVAVAQAGGHIHAIYYCPHRPDENCTCRKPQPGMYLQAAEELCLDLSRSYVIGDTRRDAEAACAIGARALLVQTGEGCDRQNGHGCASCLVECVIVQDLLGAVEWICEKEQVSP